jgi:simple sugar transport system ATP-binding protein
VLRHSIAENAILGIHRSAPIADHGLLSRRTIRQLAERLVNTYDVRCPGIRTEARLLSGGNLQKLILARELDRNPNLILAAHPTRGLDVSATEYIHRILLEHRDRGAAVLFVSSELEELFRISDRLLVLYEGRAMGIVAPGTTSMEEIGLLMAGETTPVSLGEE